MSFEPVEIVSPAPDWVLARICDDTGLSLIAGQRLRAAVLRQFYGSDITAALLSGGELIAVAGIYETLARKALWFCGGPDLKQRRTASRRAGLGLIKKISGGYDPLITYVRTDIPAPPRLARIMGFVPTGETGRVGHCLFEVYIWDPKPRSLTPKSKPPINGSATEPQSKRKRPRRKRRMKASASAVKAASS